MRLSVASVLLVGLVAVEAQQQCYYAAGKAARNEYVPCGSGSGFTSCCKAGDFCLADGACFGPDTTMTYIAGCTDPNYSSSACRAGADTCNKDSQFQGIAMCGSSWVCCEGQGQRGDGLPSSDFAKSCPCDQGFATAIPNAGTLAAVFSLPTSFPTSRSTPISSSTRSSDSQSDSVATTSDSSSQSTTLQTSISLSINPTDGIQGTGTGSDQSSQTDSSSDGGGGGDKNLKVGLGAGIPLGVAAVAAVGAALFFFRRRLMRSEPQYVTQADLSTPVWQGEAPGSGMPAEGGAAGGWKANGGGGTGSYNQMREVGGDSPHRPASQGILQSRPPQL